MITARLQIDDGEILDTYTGHGLIFMQSDKYMEAPIKERDSTAYAGEAGEHIDPRTVQDAFDYEVTFVVVAPNKDLENANAVIAKFNEQLYTQEYGSDVRNYKTVTFYDDYKHVKIVGLPSPIAEVKSLYRRQDGMQLDCVKVEFAIRVYDPTMCDFNLSV